MPSGCQLFSCSRHLVFFGCATWHLAYLVLQPGIESESLAVRAWSRSHWTARELPQPIFWFTLYQTQPHQFSSPIHAFSNVPLASHTRCYQNKVKSPHILFFLTILIPSFASDHTNSNHPKAQTPPTVPDTVSTQPFLQPPEELTIHPLSSLLVMSKSESGIEQAGSTQGLIAYN